MVASPAARPTCSAPCVVESRNTRSAVVLEPAELHDLAPPCERGKREPVRDPLAPRREVGRDAVNLLRAAVVPAETGDVLVEDQQGAVAPDRLLQSLQVAVARRLRPLGLEHEARRSGPGARRGEPRPTRDRHSGTQVSVSRRRAGNPAANRLDDHRPVVVRKEGMVGADRDEVTAGVGARELDAAGVRGRSVLRELDHLGASRRGEERFGRLELESRRADEVRAQRRAASRPPRPRAG